jgi:hypothetical protein
MARVNAMSKRPSNTGGLDQPAAVCVGVVPAVAADSLEGVALLNVLAGNDIDVNARRARGAALVKFTVLAGALFYNGLGHLPRRHRDFT